MTTLAMPAQGPDIALPRMSAVHALALGFVWITFAASGIVFFEPAPVDALMMATILLLPILGLVRITPPLMLVLTIWLIAGACALVGTIKAVDTKVALTHTAVTFFLTLSSFVISGFVMRRPYKHTHLIMHAYAFAAAVAAVCALIGYFRLVPGAYDLFTRFDRASGTFKDPNVLGAFLVPPIVYLLHRVLTRGLGAGMWAGLWAGLIGLAVLVTFSRGAWVNLAVSITIFGYLAFVTAPTSWQRLRILVLGFAAISAGLIVLVVALQIDGVADQLANRATLDQSYDQGPEGRFGGQAKARRLIVDNPLGIGAQQFAPQYHMEEPHNVYLFMFLHAGWLGGLIFAIMVGLTCLYGLRHAFKRTTTQPLFIVIFACFVALALEGFIIDLDHWRHFHVLMALVWGLMLGDRVIAQRLSLMDPRRAFDAGEMIVPSRPPRLLAPAKPELTATYLRRVVTVPPRREAGRADSRPSRASGRTFARNTP